MSVPLALNDVTAPDAYSASVAVLDGLPVCRQLNFQVVNQAIFYQLRQAPSGGLGMAAYGDWSPEVKLLPSYAVLVRTFVGVRFRAATKVASLPAGSNQAIVQLEAIPAQ